MVFLVQASSHTLASLQFSPHLISSYPYHPVVQLQVTLFTYLYSDSVKSEEKILTRCISVAICFGKKCIRMILLWGKIPEYQHYFQQKSQIL